jgi:hypothetical protein
VEALPSEPDFARLDSKRDRFSKGNIVLAVPVLACFCAGCKGSKEQPHLLKSLLFECCSVLYLLAVKDGHCDWFALQGEYRQLEAAELNFVGYRRKHSKTEIRAAVSAAMPLISVF